MLLERIGNNANTAVISARTCRFLGETAALAVAIACFVLPGRLGAAEKKSPPAKTPKGVTLLGEPDAQAQLGGEGDDVNVDFGMGLRPPRTVSADAEKTKTETQTPPKDKPAQPADPVKNETAQSSTAGGPKTSDKEVRPQGKAFKNTNLSVAEVKGTVVVSDGVTERPFRPGDTLRPGETIRTSEGAQVVLQTEQGAKIMVPGGREATFNYLNYDAKSGNVSGTAVVKPLGSADEGKEMDLPATGIRGETKIK